MWIIDNSQFNFPLEPERQVIRNYARGYPFQAWLAEEHFYRGKKRIWVVNQN